MDSVTMRKPLGRVCILTVKPYPFHKVPAAQGLTAINGFDKGPAADTLPAMRHLHRPVAAFVILLSGCVSEDGSRQVVDGVALQVARDDNYYWPQTIDAGAAEVFPLVTALVVTGAGAPLGPEDEARARQAAAQHCNGLGRSGPSTASRFDEGAWAFYPC
jgi:hypothetical protein